MSWSRSFTVATLAPAALLVAAAASCSGIATRVSRPPEYRVPWVVLAYPTRGSTLPADRPLLVFRFAPGEPTDPIDPSSFRVAVDGVDRTALFRVTATEAWANLADSSAGTVLGAGAHVVTARICSARGACATASEPVTVKGIAADSPATAPLPSA